jgi:predicted ATPase/class 3 adenylate cyclase
VRGRLPTGSVTLLFTDIEGSTRLLQDVGAEQYAAALETHRVALRGAFAAHGGVEVDTQGDAFFYSFADPAAAVAAADQAQRDLADGPVRVRIGMHTGRPHVSAGGYVGEDVHLGARIAAAGHGGQVLVSGATRRLLDQAPPMTALGEHRFKDFGEPVAIFQLGDARHPPLRTISNTNLPRPATSFVGRDREAEEIADELRRGTRLLTITGPGGSGKTRLAIEVAARLVPSMRAGVFWVGLADLRDPALVTDSIAATLGARGDVAEHIGERELLLLLDNAEHVAAAGPALAAMVERCPNLVLVMTSRERLRVRGETAYSIGPLTGGEAAELFSVRSRIPVDQTVVELCRRLDNLPLAVELAAARAGVLPPAGMLDRIADRLDLLRGGGDVDPRQQTLRATIDWSYDLLSADEQRVFEQFGVFQGGCRLESAEDVAGADLDSIESLVDKSLIRQSGGRFFMLETIREFAVERLEQDGSLSDVGDRHAQHFLALVEEAEPHLLEYSDQWLDRIELETPNVRAALDWFIASGRAEEALRMAGALPRFWDERAHLGEGQRYLARLLDRDEAPTRARARALNAAADMAVSIGDARLAAEHAERARRAFCELGDEDGRAVATFLLGLALVDQGETEQARAIFEECAAHFRDTGAVGYQLVAVRGLAWTSYSLGERDRGRRLHEQNLADARAAGIPHIEASSLSALAMIALDEGRVADAAVHLRDRYATSRSEHDLHGAARDAGRAARLLAALGRDEAAVSLLAWTEHVFQETGSQPRPWLAEMNAETLATVRSRLDDGVYAAAWSQGLAMAPGDAAELARRALG